MVAALLVLALGACGDGRSVDGAAPTGGGATSEAVRTTPAALIAIAEEYLDATATDVEVERIRPPECPRGSDARLACGRFPPLPGRAVKLDACTGRTLEDDSMLVTGRHDVHQEGSYLLAVLTTADHVVVVGTSAVPVPEFTVHELADIATAPEAGPRVDPAYVVRGQELTGG